MKLTLDNPVGVGAPFGDRFSHLARLDHGDGALLLLSGQVAVDDQGAVIAPGDAGAQAARVFEIIEGILAAHGAAFADVMHVRTFMTSLADLPAYAAVRRRYFPGPPPASTTVEVSRLFLPGLVLEVEVTAAVSAAARLPDRPGARGRSWDSVVMRYMVIERYRHGPGPVYERVAAQGRMLPEGLAYLDSWIVDDPSMDHCFQLMETSDPALFDAWFQRWSDLVSFELFPVITSAEASTRAAGSAP